MRGRVLLYRRNEKAGQGRTHGDQRTWWRGLRIGDRRKTSTLRLLAEVGVQAKTFPAAAQLTSWVGNCPGKEESAEENRNSRSAKGTNTCGGC